MTATDISPTAVQLLKEAALRAGIAPERVRAFTCDSADAGAGESLLSGILTMHCSPNFSTQVHISFSHRCWHCQTLIHACKSLYSRGVCVP